MESESPNTAVLYSMNNYPGKDRKHRSSNRAPVRPHGGYEEEDRHVPTASYMEGELRKKWYE